MDQADGSAQGEMRATFLAFSEDGPVGITALYRNEKDVNEGEALQVWVAPKTRGTGLAQRLMATTLAWAEEQGVETALATISKSNLGAVAFYEKCGFVLVHEQSRDGDCDLVYEKKI
jgi:GNAT superfamily N-acetyltransferase